MHMEFIKDGSDKSAIVKEVLSDLPEWFGLPESTESYITEVVHLPLIVAKENENVLGFITLKETSGDSCEIHCMGIKKNYHRKGIGKELYKQIEKLAAKTYDYIQVKTVDSGHYKEYDQTVLFYKSLGFKELEVFLNLWSEHTPCLILIKKLEGRS